MASYNSSDVTDMIRSKRVFLGTYCPPSSSCGGGGGNGETGPTGPPGSDGKTILNGVGAPGSSVGTPGDFYLDTSSYVLYGPKYSNYYQNWPNMAGSLYLGTPNIYNYAYLQTLPASNVVCNVNILPISNLNIQFAGYDNSNVAASLVITNTSTNISSEIILDLSTKYSLVTGTTYNLEYTCVSGNTLVDLRFQNGCNSGQQVMWTNNPWFVSENLVGPAGVDGVTGPTGPVAGSDTQIIFNQSGLAGATETFTFDYTSGTLNVSSLNVANTTNMSGNLFMNLCNICNVGTEGFSKQLAELAFSTPPLSTTVSGEYTYYLLGSDTSLSVVGGSVSNVKYFAVGGGGGGGLNLGAGGGAGGLQTNDLDLSGIVTLSQYNTGYITLCAASYSIIVGSGGLGDIDGTGNGQSGGNTTFSGTGITSITALGGGGGGSYTGDGPHTGADGGCGGGGSFTPGAVEGKPDLMPGGLGSQGYAGGYGTTVLYTTGGGGGLGSLGGDAGEVSGNGGSAISYLNVSYGGGGGGGAGSPSYSSGVGGGGGAGDGSFYYEIDVYPPGGDALPNTGSGGGGGGNVGVGGVGGSGIFILGVPTDQASLSGLIMTKLGTIRIDKSLNMSINSTNNIVLNPSGGNVYVSGNIVPTISGTFSLGTADMPFATAHLALPVVSDMTGFYNVIYNPTTGQLAYYVSP